MLLFKSLFRLLQQFLEVRALAQRVQLLAGLAGRQIAEALVQRPTQTTDGPGGIIILQPGTEVSFLRLMPLVGG